MNPPEFMNVLLWNGNWDIFYRMSEYSFNIMMTEGTVLANSSVRLDSFTPLTEETLHLISMCHPDVDIRQLEACESGWQEKRIFSRTMREWYLWNAQQSRWD